MEELEENCRKVHNFLILSGGQTSIYGFILYREHFKLNVIQVAV
jgi:hypothetical protein